MSDCSLFSHTKCFQLFLEITEGWGVNIEMFFFLYLLNRCFDHYQHQTKLNKNKKNPVFWCNIFEELLQILNELCGDIDCVHKYIIKST